MDLFIFTLAFFAFWGLRGFATILIFRSLLCVVQGVLLSAASGVAVTVPPFFFINLAGWGGSKLCNTFHVVFDLTMSKSFKNNVVSVTFKRRFLSHAMLCMEIDLWNMHAHVGRTLPSVDRAPQDTPFWRRRIWDKVGGQSDESFRFADWGLLLRFRATAAKFDHISLFMNAYRMTIAK